MTTSTRATSNPAACALLNRLIVACNDGARAQRAASLVVHGSEHRARLEDSAGRRSAFANELGELVRSFGGTPAEGGSTVEAVRAAIHWIDVLLVGEHGGDTYGSCARIEAAAEELYERAKDDALPEPAGSIVVRHHAEVASARVELRRLSMGG